MPGGAADRWMLLGVVAVVVVSSVSSVVAPFLFSRLIDHLPRERSAAALAGGFLLYPALLGLSAALLRMVQHLAYMSAENLAFITSDDNYLFTRPHQFDILPVKTFRDSLIGEATRRE
jgi:hypothetical protein